LQGLLGALGLLGPQGPQGVFGNQGPPGNQGFEGSQGAQGHDGYCTATYEDIFAVGYDCGGTIAYAQGWNWTMIELHGCPG
jgi:hypothetical protein